MTSSTTTAPKYKVGDVVELSEDTDRRYPLTFTGSVTEVRPPATPGAEFEYVVREVETGEPDVEMFMESELIPDRAGVLDLDNPYQLLTELEDVVTSTSEYGIRSADYADRIRALSRVSFLASRLAWLTASDLHAEQMMSRVAPRAAKTRVRGSDGVTRMVPAESQ